MADPSPPLDPLTALRRADPRPVHERWRARLLELVARTDTIGSAWVLALAVAALAALIAWRALTPGDPPLADSLPYAPAVESGVSAPAIAPIVEEPADVPSPSAVGAPVIHVAGAVARPGLVAGAGGWRVADAIEAAGGPLAVADLDRLNLAAVVRDGQRVYVPEIGEAAIPAVAGEVDDSGATGPLDLNAATSAGLDALPGVGPATADAIVAHRDEHGPFGSVDALVAVRGIGPAKLEALREHVVVG